MALRATQDHKDSAVLADPNLKDLSESLGQSYMALRATQDHKDSAVLADPNLKDLPESLGQILRSPRRPKDDRLGWGRSIPGPKIGTWGTRPESLSGGGYRVTRRSQSTPAKRIRPWYYLGHETEFH